MSIDQAQSSINEEIAKLNGDAERIVFYLLTLGQRNPGMESSYRTEENLVKGCHTKIWFRTATRNNRVYLSVDSNTMITKGLGSLLVRLLDGQRPDDILNADLQLFFQKQFARYMGSDRSDGFNRMIRHLKVAVGQL